MIILFLFKNILFNGVAFIFINAYKIYDNRKEKHFQVNCLAANKLNSARKPFKS